jgi:hypothetical protein
MMGIADSNSSRATFASPVTSFGFAWTLTSVLLPVRATFCTDGPGILGPVRASGRPGQPLAT